ncbi:MAG: hypothetical protein JWP64_1739 [Pseudonocardia sp.]|jgi:hypothetical protein|nr:hypothetical protein [Pseudonocardia sp.]
MQARDVAQLLDGSGVFWVDPDELADAIEAVPSRAAVDSAVRVRSPRSPRYFDRVRTSNAMNSSDWAAAGGPPVWLQAASACSARHARSPSTPPIATTRRWREPCGRSAVAAPARAVGSEPVEAASPARTACIGRPTDPRGGGGWRNLGKSRRSGPCSAAAEPGAARSPLLAEQRVRQVQALAHAPGSLAAGGCDTRQPSGPRSA